MAYASAWSSTHPPFPSSQRGNIADRNGERKREDRVWASVGAETSLPSCAASALPRHYVPHYVNVPKMEKLITELAADATQKLSTATIKKQLKQIQQQEPLAAVSFNELSGKKQTLADSAGLAGFGRAGAKDGAIPPAAPLRRAKAAEESSGLACPKTSEGEREKEDREDAQMTTQTAVASVFGQAELLSLLPESRFRNLMQRQVQRLNFFVQSKEREISQRLCHIYSAVGLMREQHGFTPDVAARLEEELDAQSAEITHLDFFVRRNYKALVDLGHLFDRLLETDTTRWFIFSLIKEKFCNVDLEGLMLRLSLAWSAFRQAKAGVTESGKWEAPETFVRNTTKYWLRSDRVVQAQCLILKHLPFLVYGASEEDIAATLLGQPQGKTGSGDAENAVTKQEKGKAEDLKPNIGASQPITSVYVDSNTGYCFENRILRMEGAELIRFRWYGVNDNDGDKTVFVERKTHHESWTGLSSTKERFALDQKFVKSYLIGRLPAAEALGVQFRERWWKEKEAKEREKEKEKEREKEEALGVGGYQGKQDGVGDSERGAEDEAQGRTKKDESAEKRRRWEREAEEAEIKFFQDPKTQKSLQLACEIQNTLLSHSLLPMVRTSYLRAAFQLSTSNAVRISLDTNLCMVDELTPQYVSLGREEERRGCERAQASDALSGSLSGEKGGVFVDGFSLWESLRRPEAQTQKPASVSARSQSGGAGGDGGAEERDTCSGAKAVTGDLERLDRMREDDDDVLWCRVAEELLGKNDVVRFPFAVLEVKLQTSPGPPWVQELLALCDAIMVPKFSKFQHGMAFLHSDKICRLPYWLQASPEAEGGRRDRDALGRGLSLDSHARDGQRPLARERREGGEHAQAAAASLPPFSSGLADLAREGSCGVDDRRTDGHYCLFGSRRGTLFYSPIVRSVEEGEGAVHSVHSAQLVEGFRHPAEASSKPSRGDPTLSCVSVGDDLPTKPSLTQFTRRAKPCGKSTLGTDAARTLDWLRQRHTEALAEDFYTPSDSLEEPRVLASQEEGFGVSEAHGRRSGRNETSSGLPRSESPQRSGDDGEEDDAVLARQTKKACLRKVLRQSKKMRKLDPKSFFANERTFLQYLQKAVYLGSLAIVLLQWGGVGVFAEMAGLCLAFAVLALLAYSYRIFEERGRKLERKVARGDLNAGERYDSTYGPVLAFASVSLIVLFILTTQIDAGVRKLESV
ncbi:hypothetical protein NCLIV_009410 [Neospora caninum Liverpool]|uniref:Vacuolar transporter chaperone 3, related n=1 Tax=Neospora caninum (strain Liverpool) TaxID=572307 RepID=F0V9P5_NEOCL|nr:hypothetical protein NCLIV_009410 [Neospora caninum Liverpool]CBZ50471.1 hypothetical protein NCLIV_009410 [Neospora caninum Liverpool]CEL65081.1 TPA: Vacuolar transporter chaperone 3, related [Neospora caninum Liverpool]|eukprot:XP_003880504.1 hypothetical protein NCLIV_009410 [Neospora caninum Liverpool]